MTNIQRTAHRELYNQLRLALVYPGESLAGVTKPYAPIDKWALSWEELMQCPDTPDIAARRNVRQTSFLVRLGRHGVGAVKYA